MKASGGYPLGLRFHVGLTNPASVGHLARPLPNQRLHLTTSKAWPLHAVVRHRPATVETQTRARPGHGCPPSFPPLPNRVFCLAKFYV